MCSSWFLRYESCRETLTRAVLSVEYDDLRRSSWPQGSAQVFGENPQPAFESVEGPLSGDLDNKGSGEDCRQSGHDTGGDSACYPDRSGQKQHASKPGGVCTVGLERMTVHSELPVIWMLFDAEGYVFINIAGYETEDSRPPREGRTPGRSVVSSACELGSSQRIPNPLFSVFRGFAGRHLIGEDEVLPGLLAGQFREPYGKTRHRRIMWNK